MPQFLRLFLAIPRVQQVLGDSASPPKQQHGGGEIEGHMVVIEDLLRQQASK
jgi:hypothetical protein